MRALRIGLTGPIGCGKSTVGGWLAEAGARLVDADAVAREVTAPGMAAHDAIVARFGDTVTDPEGRLDRAALARIVFADPGHLAALEAIVHPAVRPVLLARVEEAEADGAPVVAIEAIKLVESSLATLCDEVWLVRCGPGTQRERLTGRGMADDDAARRIAVQGDLEARLTVAATRVIDTSGSADGVRERVLAAAADALSRRA